MAVRMQDVLTTDPLRTQVYSLVDIGTLVVDTGVDFVQINGLSGHGGTIVDIQARCVTKPSGTATGTRYDLNINGTTMFVNTGSSIIFTKTSSGAAATTVPNVASGGAFSSTRSGKVFNGDIIELACDDLADSAVGADLAVSVLVRYDEPND
jgi:butyrate kinase